jgi:hypothetical protein
LPLLLFPLTRRLTATELPKSMKKISAKKFMVKCFDISNWAF